MRPLDDRLPLQPGQHRGYVVARRLEDGRAEMADWVWSLQKAYAEADRLNARIWNSQLGPTARRSAKVEKRQERLIREMKQVIEKVVDYLNPGAYHRLPKSRSRRSPRWSMPRAN